MNKISIVIPVFNEAENIPNLFNEIVDSLTSKYTYEVIFVNDASTDNSDSILSQINKKKFVKVLINENNFGQSYSIMKGIKSASYDTIVTIDGDNQNIPKDIPKLLDLYFFHKDVLLIGGIRVKRRDSFIKIISSRIANKVRSVILNDGCSDTGCGLKVLSRKIFLKLPFFDGIHRFLPALFKGYGCKTMFIEVGHRPRLKGISKYGIIGRFYKGIRDIIRVKKIINNL